MSNLDHTKIVEKNTRELLLKIASAFFHLKRTAPAYIPGAFF